MDFNINNFISNPSSITSTVTNTLGTIGSTVNTLKNKATSLVASVSDPASLMKTIRSASIPAGAETGVSSGPASVSVAQVDKTDWRVTLSIPPGDFQDSWYLKILRDAGNKVIFPYTPTINVSHKAGYNDLSPVHSNYPFLSYSGSKVDDITIEAPFFVEDAKEAQYWLAVVHYFRSVTKMAYGESAFQGSPPPVIRLNGYGPDVFNNVPVVVENFSLSLPNDVDYISAGPLGGNTRVPIKSTLSITVKPIYSREQIRNFSLSKFVSGGYIVGNGEFI